MSEKSDKEISFLDFLDLHNDIQNPSDLVFLCSLKLRRLLVMSAKSDKEIYLLHFLHLHNDTQNPSDLVFWVLFET